MFNNYFYSVLTQPRDYDFLPDIPVYKHAELGSISVNESEVLDILNHLDITKAGDGLSPRVLKECAQQIISPLCHMFNLSLRTQVLPRDWLRANVVPV